MEKDLINIFFRAIQRNDFEKIKWLVLEQSFDVSIQNNFALNLCVRKNNLPLLQFFIEHGANFEHVKDKLLEETAFNKDITCIQYLYEHGANLNHFHGQALSLAVEFNNLVITKFLVEHGADIYINNHSALRYGLKQTSIDCLEYIISQYEDINLATDVIHFRLNYKESIYMPEASNKWFESFLLKQKLSNSLPSDNSTSIKNKI